MAPPSPWARMMRAASRATRKYPVRLISSARRHLSPPAYPPARRRRDAGRAHHDIHAAPVSHHAVEGLGHGFFLGDIHAQGQRAARFRGSGGGLLGSGAIDIAEGHRGSGFHQALRDAASQAGGRAGDQRHLARQRRAAASEGFGAVVLGFPIDDEIGGCRGQVVTPPRPSASAMILAPASASASAASSLSGSPAIRKVPTPLTMATRGGAFSASRRL